MNQFLGADPENFCSQQTARMMAMACFQRGLRHSGSQPEGLAGVGCTASLISDHPKQGAHRVHVALQTAHVTESLSVELSKGQRTRAGEERICAKLILNATASACQIVDQVGLGLKSDERVVRQRHEASTDWTALLLGYEQSCCIGSTNEAPAQVIFPGAFNPLHDGHRAMARLAQQRLGKPVAYEMTLFNVDKPPLDFIELAQRLDAFADEVLWLTRAATFLDKSQLFPGATFVVGADTLVRITDPKYYQDDPDLAVAATESLRERGCRFFVFGRVMAGRFSSLSELNLPTRLREICQEVTSDEFRMDLSSTQMRHVRPEASS